MDFGLQSLRCLPHGLPHSQRSPVYSRHFSSCPSLLGKPWCQCCSSCASIQPRCCTSGRLIECDTPGLWQSPLERPEGHHIVPCQRPIAEGVRWYRSQFCLITSWSIRESLLLSMLGHTFLTESWGPLGTRIHSLTSCTWDWNCACTSSTIQCCQHHRAQPMPCSMLSPWQSMSSGSTDASIVSMVSLLVVSMPQHLRDWTEWSSLHALFNTSHRTWVPL